MVTTNKTTDRSIKTHPSIHKLVHTYKDVGYPSPEYIILGVVSVICDGVGGIVKGGDEEMVEEGQHGRMAAETFL